MRTVFLLIIVLLAGPVTPVSAQDEAEPQRDEAIEEAAEPVRRYTVELIIFAYAESVSSGNEVWMPEAADIEAGGAAHRNIYFGDRDEDLAEIEAPSARRRYMDLELELLDDDDFTMDGIYDKLVQLDAYEPLVRAGWTQPTYDKAVTASIPLNVLADSPPWLNGNLILYLGRYLHLVVDLTMDADRSRLGDPRDSQSGLPSFGDARIRSGYEAIDEYGEPLPPPVRYRIFEDRIMKNGDIRYFDHPKFGVIAKITRVEDPVEEIFDDTGDLMPAALPGP